MNSGIFRRAQSTALSILFVSLAMVSLPSNAQIQFSNATNSSLEGFSSETWGASIGDYNDDYWADIFVGNHRQRPSLYRNNGDGSLSNVILQVDTTGNILENRFIDHHGAGWTDVDGDGDDDLLASTNGCCPANFLVSDGKRFVDEAAARGLANDGAGWAVAWLERNGDGLIDVGSLRFGNSTQFLDQNNGGTFLASTTAGCGTNINYGQITDINADGNLDLVCAKDGTFPQQVYDLSTFTDITSQAPTISNTIDTVAADFNNDLLPDIFAVRGIALPNGAKRVAPNRLEASLDASTNSGEATVTFQSTGIVSMVINSRFTSSTLIRGAGGTASTAVTGTAVTLDPSDPANQGIVANRSGRRFYVGYDNATSTWTIIQSGTSWWYTYVEIESTSAVSSVASPGLNDADLPIRPRMERQTATGWQNRTWDSGFRTDISCISASAGDFDNDMDLDLYLVCRDAVENTSNRLYENNGSGFFTEVANAGGAGGVLGSGLLSGAGLGETVVSADFNNDGYLDLFVTNGLRTQPVRNGGPHELMMNNGGSNRWISLKLRGTTSNPSAVGARVYATAGGQQQYREQGGSYHRWSQNSQRIHFGLGTNSSVDISVVWPTGVVENFTGLASNRIYEITEGGAASAVTLGPVADFDAPISGDECGDPSFLGDIDQALFLTRDCGSGLWTLTASPGGGSLRWVGTISNSASFSGLSTQSFEGGDTATTTSDGMQFDVGVAGSGTDTMQFFANEGCLAISAPSTGSILVGPGHSILGNSIDLSTLQPCTGGGSPTISILDTTVSESVGNALVTIQLSQPSAQTVSVTWSTNGAAGSATPGADYYGGSGTVTFVPGGALTATASVPILDDAQQESDETIVFRLFNAQGAAIASANATVTIEDNDTPGGTDPFCGQPVIDPTSQPAIAIWKDCPSGAWHLRAYSGGSSTVARYDGSFDSNQNVSGLVGFSLENSDVLTNSPANQIDFILRMVNAGVDGFDFSVPSGADTCFDLTLNTIGAPVVVGAASTVVSPPFDIETLTTCN